MLVMKRIFARSGQHQAVTFLAGMAGIGVFMMAILTEDLDSHSTRPLVRNDTLVHGVWHNATYLGRARCTGVHCVELTFWMLALFTVIGYGCTEWFILRLNRGACDTGLRPLRPGAVTEETVLKQADPSLQSEVLDDTRQAEVNFNPAAHLENVDENLA